MGMGNYNRYKKIVRHKTIFYCNPQVNVLRKKNDFMCQIIDAVVNFIIVEIEEKLHYLRSSNSFLATWLALKSGTNSGALGFRRRSSVRLASGGVAPRTGSGASGVECAPPTSRANPLVDAVSVSLNMVS